MILVEVVILAGLALGMGRNTPHLLAAEVIGAGEMINSLTGLASLSRRVMGEHEATAHLVADIAQISALMALLGGSANPFIMSLIVPVTLAAAVPSMDHRVATSLANVVAMVLVAAYVRRSAAEAACMVLALDVTQAVLAQE